MAAFRGLLITAWLALVIYTGSVIAEHGLDLLPVFVGDIAKVAWPGQFNADFLCFLALSAFWTAWRNAFTPRGIALGVVAFFGGAGFLLIYLLILSQKTGGDVRALLVGPHRAYDRAR